MRHRVPNDGDVALPEHTIHARLHYVAPRLIQYRLLGRDAMSVAYTYDIRREVEPTHGADGAYLVVGPGTPTFCAELPRYSLCGSNGVAPNSILGGMILSVRYRNGRTCQPAALDTRLPAFARQCLRIGHVAPKPLLHESQVASPVSFHLIPAKRYCSAPTSGPRYGFGEEAASDLGGYLPCNGAVPARDERPGLVERGTLVVFSWTARQAVTSCNTEYEYFLGSGACGGQGGSTYGRVTAGERLTRGIVFQTSCAGTRAASGYEPNLGPGGGDFAGANPGRDGSLLVGRFKIRIPPHGARTGNTPKARGWTAAAPGSRAAHSQQPKRSSRQDPPSEVPVASAPLLSELPDAPEQMFADDHPLSFDRRSTLT